MRVERDRGKGHAVRVRSAILGAVVVAAVGAVMWLGGHRGDGDSLVPDPIAVARNSRKPVLVEFGAGTCAACREMKTVPAALEASHRDRMMILDIEFGTAEGRRILRDYGMQAIPTQLFFAADGSELGRHLGAVQAADILERLGLADG